MTIDRAIPMAARSPNWLSRKLSFTSALEIIRIIETFVGLENHSLARIIESHFEAAEDLTADKTIIFLARSCPFGVQRKLNGHILQREASYFHSVGPSGNHLLVATCPVARILSSVLHRVDQFVSLRKRAIH